MSRACHACQGKKARPLLAARQERSIGQGCCATLWLEGDVMMPAQPGQRRRRNLRALGLRLVNSVSSSWSLLIPASPRIFHISLHGLCTPETTFYPVHRRLLHLSQSWNRRDHTDSPIVEFAQRSRSPPPRPLTESQPLPTYSPPPSVTVSVSVDPT